MGCDTTKDTHTQQYATCSSSSNTVGTEKMLEGLAIILSMSNSHFYCYNYTHFVVAVVKLILGKSFPKDLECSLETDAVVSNKQTSYSGFVRWHVAVQENFAGRINLAPTQGTYAYIHEHPVAEA